jgi:hypothetical protein
MDSGLKTDGMTTQMVVTLLCWFVLTSAGTGAVRRKTKRFAAFPSLGERGLPGRNPPGFAALPFLSGLHPCQAGPDGKQRRASSLTEGDRSTAGKR